MSKYTIQDTIEENGVKILKNKLDSNFFLINDFADIVGKDKYPDIDGQIRLRDGNGTYLNRYLHYQTKSHKKIIPEKYYLDKDIINYLIETNVPTLFFVVDTKYEKVFWFFISQNDRKTFNPEKGKSINLSSNEINSENIQEVHQSWQIFSKRDSYKNLVDGLDKILDKFKLNIQFCLGILYLFRAIKKQEFPKIISNLLNIKEHESKTIIEHLENEDIISSTVNYYLLENEKLGIESSFLLFYSKLLNFENLDKQLNLDNKKVVFEQLNKINHPKINKYFNDLSKFKNDDDIFENLELLEKYIDRTPNQAIQILKTIINSKKSHNNLIEKSIDLLERLRYIKPKEVFSLLLKLSKSKNKTIREKAIKSLEKQAEYNLSVLQKIEYQPQIFLLGEIEKFGNRLIINFNAISAILEQIVRPSFEENEMTDYETFTIRRGGLNANKNLKNIRERAIEVLQKLFLLSETIPQKKKILKILREATQTPYDNYTNGLEKLILGNTNKIIQFYNEIVENAEHEIVKEIEEQSHWFIKRYSKKLKNIKKLQSLISQNDEYSMFKIFVGYDHHFDGKLDRKKVEKERKEKIQEFVNQISNSNFNEWQSKILSVINNYNQVKDHDRYQYFNIFLHELGKQKPKITQKLILNNKTRLEEFLIHLVAGIWLSKSKNIAIKFIEDSINRGQHLSLCTYIFSYVKEIDEKLLTEAFKKAKQKKDVNALNKTIRSIVDNYQHDKGHTKLFIKVIKELTKLQNYWWINNVWYQEESIIEKLSEDDFNIILSNLLLVPNIDYHTEVILKTITKKQPLKIIKFFEKRVSVQLKKKMEDKYDAIPYSFQELNSTLQEYGKVIIPEVLKWFKKKNCLFNWDGGDFLKNIYSIHDLDYELVKLLNTGKEKDIKIVLSILSTYQGHITLDSKAIQILIKKYPKYHDSVISYMSATGGVVSGEYGFVNSLKGKKEAVQKWKKDKRKYMQSFIEEYEESLNEQIDYEKKRAYEDLKLRKHEYK